MGSAAERASVRACERASVRACERASARGTRARACVRPAPSRRSSGSSSKKTRMRDGVATTSCSCGSGDEVDASPPGAPAPPVDTSRRIACTIACSSSRLRRDAESSLTLVGRIAYRTPVCKGEGAAPLVGSGISGAASRAGAPPGGWPRCSPTARPSVGPTHEAAAVEREVAASRRGRVRARLDRVEPQEPRLAREHLVADLLEVGLHRPLC